MFDNRFMSAKICILIKVNFDLVLFLLTDFDHYQNHICDFHNTKYMIFYVLIFLYETK